jgi:putative nucleotidyltransferase with HDIG domain
MDTSKAKVLSGRLLSPLGNRWAHVQAVAAQGQKVALALPEADRETLVVACWLHDIGYAPDAKTTGFHPLDGARYLAEMGCDERIVSLVAYHSGAVYEAEERGLASALAGFAVPSDPVLLDALTYSDMTTGPAGQPMTFEGRIAEILSRYGPDDLVHRAITRSQFSLGDAVTRTEARLAVRVLEPR